MAVLLEIPKNKNIGDNTLLSQEKPEITFLCAPSGAPRPSAMNPTAANHSRTPQSARLTS
jgi:hypothetical protein